MYMKERKGFTLVELLIVLALMSIIITFGTGYLTFGSKGHSMTFEEFNIQSDLRIVSQKINSIIREASATFILHREDAELLTDEWNYIMLNEDKTGLFEYNWNPTTKKHDKIERAGSVDGSTLELLFDKDSNPDEDKLIQFTLTLKKGDKERVLETELESLNSLQIIDRSYDKAGNTLAYRYDTRVDNVSNAQAVVGMVLDTSGSMAKTMSNDPADDLSPNANKHSRIKKMKAEAVRLVEKLAEKPNIYISTIPFSYTANNPHAMLNVKTSLTTIKHNIDDLKAKGGTNTGDGIRRAYYRISDFNELEENKNRTNKNFMIILVDGVTTLASVTRVVNETITIPTDVGKVYNYEGYDYIKPSRDRDAINTITVYKDEGDSYTVGTTEYSKAKTTEYREVPHTTYKGSSYTVRETIGRTEYQVEYIYDRTEESYWGGNRYYYKAYKYEYKSYNYTFNGVRKDDYFTGDNNISTLWASNNTYYSGGAYAGDGSNLDPWGTEYVDIIGEMVKKYKEETNEAIKVYVIGFSAIEDDYGSLKDIALATRGDDTYYEAGDSAALESIFNSIQRDISDALWHIGGPN